MLHISDIWKDLNAMNLVYMKYCMEQAVRTLFCVCISTLYRSMLLLQNLLSLLFIKFHDNILPLLLYNELFHG